jgi:hypothetical protein
MSSKKTKRKIRVEPFCVDSTTDEDGIKTAWTLIPTIQVWYHSYFRQRHYGIAILVLDKSIGVNVIVQD